MSSRAPTPYATRKPPARAPRRSLLTPRADPGGAPGTYGYGFNVRATPLKVGHGGGAPRVNAEIALCPEFGWQLIAVANRDPPVASQMVTVLEKALLAPDPETACASAGPYCAVGHRVRAQITDH